jgi:hypothetical protein
MLAEYGLLATGKCVEPGIFQPRNLLLFLTSVICLSAMLDIGLSDDDVQQEALRGKLGVSSAARCFRSRLMPTALVGKTAA